MGMNLATPPSCEVRAMENEYTWCLKEAFLTMIEGRRERRGCERDLRGLGNVYESFVYVVCEDWESRS